MSFKLQLVHTETSELLDEWKVQVGVQEVDAFNLSSSMPKACLIGEIVDEIIRHKKYNIT